MLHFCYVRGNRDASLVRRLCTIVQLNITLYQLAPDLALQTSHRRYRNIGIAFQISHCRCHIAVIQFQIPHCRCRTAGITFHISHRRCRITGIAFQISHCKCRIAYITGHISHSTLYEHTLSVDVKSVCL
jgi:hypothetical protein